MDADPTTPTPLDLGAPDDAAVGAQVQREAEAPSEFPSQRPPIGARVRNLASELPREGDAAREAELDRLALAWHEARGAAALKAEAAFRMASGGDPRGPGHVYWRMLDRVTRLHPGCDPAGVCGEDAHDLPSPLPATEGSSAARDDEPRGTLNPLASLVHEVARERGRDGLDLLHELVETERVRLGRDALVARLRMVADNARNAGQMLVVPTEGFAPFLRAAVDKAIADLRDIAETADYAARDAGKAGA